MKYLRLFALTLILTCIFATVSYAEGEGGDKSLMGLAATKAVNVFNHVKAIIFIVGGFGLVGIAFQAIFGKVKWAWFAGLAIGLAILAAAASIVNYATGDTMGGKINSTKVEDTFQDSGEGNL